MQLIGKPHVRLNRDSKYESLDTLANVTYHQPGETMRYTSASVLDILHYLQDEAKCGNPTKPLHNELPARDALALLAAASAQSALRCLHNGHINHCFTDPTPASKQVSSLASRIFCYAHQCKMIKSGARYHASIAFSAVQFSISKDTCIMSRCVMHTPHC